MAVYLAASGGAAGLDINGDSYLAVLSNVAPTKAGTQILTDITQIAPSGGYLEAYDDHRRRRADELRRIEDAKEAEASIPDQLDAQIAQILHEQEAKDLERADLARLQALADEYKGRQRDVPERVNAALLAAQERRTLGSLLALRRETDRTMEEEELVLLLLLLNE